MRLDLNYGRGSFPLDLPDDWDVTVIRKPAMPVQPEARAQVRTALSRPVDARPLAEEARGKQTACILICDITRPYRTACCCRKLSGNCSIPA